MLRCVFFRWKDFSILAAVQTPEVIAVSAPTEHFVLFSYTRTHLVKARTMDSIQSSPSKKTHTSDYVSVAGNTPDAFESQCKLAAINKRGFSRVTSQHAFWYEGVSKETGRA